MAKSIRDELYFQKRIEEAEKRRKRILEEDKKIKAEFEEWKKNQIIGFLEKYSLMEHISEKTLSLFDSKFKEISDELKNKIENENIVEQIKEKKKEENEKGEVEEKGINHE